MPAHVAANRALRRIEPMDLSIVICTHNPRAEYLAETLDSIARQQALPPGRSLELILIDNASTAPLDGQIRLPFPELSRIVREERLGLAHARLRGFHEARGGVIVCVDDDNVLRPDYCRAVLAAFDSDPDLGAAGGKSLPRYEAEPPGWFAATSIDLACRDLGDAPLSAKWDDPDTAKAYPDCAPVGAGMAIRRAAYAEYVAAAQADPTRLALGRKGADLSSGEDNDMILTLLANGWRVAYLPILSLEHLIPARRVSADYLAAYAFSSNRTWVQVLSLHGLSPWPALAGWTLPLRKARAWWRQKPWRGPAERIAWQAACGNLVGRASISRGTGV